MISSENAQFINWKQPATNINNELVPAQIECLSHKAITFSFSDKI